jgi:hypothetical protein
MEKIVLSKKNLLERWQKALETMKEKDDFIQKQTEVVNALQ